MARPRSETLRRAILDAALELVERRGYGRLTMEGIARQAGVSKQTVYRWWPSPAAVLMEALNELAAVLVPDTDQGSLERDLRTFIRRTVAGLKRGAAPLVAGLMAEAQFDDDFARAFREEFLARRRGAMRALLVRARDRGEVAADANLDLLVEIGFGTIWYRVLGRHAPLSGRFATELTEALLALCRQSVPASASLH